MPVSILSIPFVLQRGKVYRPSEGEYVEIALALREIWRRAPKDYELAEVSRFFSAVHLVQVDGGNMVAINSSASWSEGVKCSLGVPPPPYDQLKSNELQDFVAGLERYVSLVKDGLKLSKIELKGILFGGVLSELKERLSFLEEWRVNPDEVVPAEVTLDVVCRNSAITQFLTDEKVDDASGEYRRFTAFLEERLDFFRRKVEEVEADVERERRRLREKAEREISRASQEMEDEIKRIDREKFGGVPPRITVLSRYAKRVEGKLTGLSSVSEPEDMLDKLGDAIEFLEEILEKLVSLERKCENYLKQKERFEAEKERRKRREEKRFQKRRKRILNEFEREVARMDLDVERVKELLFKAMTLREEYVASFQKWLPRAKRGVEENRRFLLSSSTVQVDAPVTVYVPFFAAKVRRDRREEVIVIPPLTIDEAGGIQASRNLEKTVRGSLERRKSLQFISTGMKRFNYLLNPKVAELFSRGLELLSKKNLVREREEKAIRTFYDRFLKPAF
ncbi:MAG: hypothetical protein ACTSWP_06805 [Candidatus Freyarchaeota archaeon]|nr:hypothetical protein [Candidatus Freyrarchaeum guaymaensis]